MAGLVPAIHKHHAERTSSARRACSAFTVFMGRRDKPGDDGGVYCACNPILFRYRQNNHQGNTMAIQVHHLNNSRSQRILWLLEEIGVPYEIVKYQRGTPVPFAPPELKAIHPLGKSPVMTDNGKTIAESGAEVEYLIDTYGKGRFKPLSSTLGS